MKAEKLAKELLKHPAFEVSFSLFEADNSKYGAGLRTFDVQISDIGYSSKVIILGAGTQKERRQCNGK